MRPCDGIPLARAYLIYANKKWGCVKFVISSFRSDMPSACFQCVGIGY